DLAKHGAAVVNGDRQVALPSGLRPEHGDEVPRDEPPRKRLVAPVSRWIPVRRPDEIGGDHAVGIPVLPDAPVPDQTEHAVEGRRDVARQDRFPDDLDVHGRVGKLREQTIERGSPPRTDRSGRGEHREDADVALPGVERVAKNRERVFPQDDEWWLAVGDVTGRPLDPREYRRP